MEIPALLSVGANRATLYRAINHLQDQHCFLLGYCSATITTLWPGGPTGRGAMAVVTHPVAPCRALPASGVWWRSTTPLEGLSTTSPPTPRTVVVSAALLRRPLGRTDGRNRLSSGSNLTVGERIGNVQRPGWMHWQLLGVGRNQ